jgi:hypothetical protein
MRSRYGLDSFRLLVVARFFICLMPLVTQPMTTITATVTAFKSYRLSLSSGYR